MRLRKSVRRRWVEALRSGEYPQATGVLAEVDGDRVVGYCCLGVLCELAKDEVPFDTVAVRTHAVNVGDGRSIYVEARTYNGAATMPPREVAEWAGSEQPRYEEWRVRRPETENGLVGAAHPWLANENDSGLSFEQIADLIENDLDAVFDLDDEEVQV